MVLELLSEYSGMFGSLSYRDSPWNLRSFTLMTIISWIVFHKSTAGTYEQVYVSLSRKLVNLKIIIAK